MDAVATHDPETGAFAVFLVNRAIEGPTTVTTEASSLAGLKVLESYTLHDDDAYANTTLAEPARVTLTVELPSISWTALSLG